MSEKFDPMENFIRVTVEEKIELTAELWSIYEALVEGLAESSVDIFKGRKMIAAATQRIGKLLGLDKIAKAISEEEVIEADVVARTIMEFMENKEVWLGSPKQLFQELEAFAFGEKEKRPRGWPKDEAVLGRKLARVAQNLKRAGLNVETKRDHDGRYISLEWHKGYGPEGRCD